MQTLFIKKILFAFIFTAFTLSLFAQAENEDGGNNNTPNGSSVITISNATAFSGDVTNSTDDFDYWTIADGTSDNVTFVLNMAKLNYDVRLVTFADASRNFPIITNEAISSGQTFSLDPAKFYSVYILSTSTLASGLYNITPTFTAVGLPVELSFFDYEIDDSAIQLFWQTLSEKENDYFEIEHSTDGENFETIGKVTGNGTTVEVTDYNFIHELPTQGENYYRLRQVDFDGSFEYSPIINTYYENKPLDITLSPSLATNSINIQFETIEAQAIIEVYNLVGVRCFQTVLDGNINNYHLDVSNFQNGQYFIRYISGNRQLTKPFLKL